MKKKERRKEKKWKRRKEKKKKWKRKEYVKYSNRVYQRLSSLQILSSSRYLVLRAFFGVCSFARYKHTLTTHPKLTKTNTHTHEH